MKYVLLGFILFKLLIVPGIASGQKKFAHKPEQLPLLKSISQNIKAKNKPFTLPAKSVTLVDALSAALRNNPMLEAYSYEIRVREAQTLQASFAQPGD